MVEVKGVCAQGCADDPNLGNCGHCQGQIVGHDEVGGSAIFSLIFSLGCKQSRANVDSQLLEICKAPQALQNVSAIWPFKIVECV